MTPMKRKLLVLSLLAVAASLSCNTLMREIAPPDDRRIDVYLYDANFYLQQGQHEQAIEAYSKAIELAPDRADLYSDRGWAYMTMEDWEHAAADYGRVIELAPSASAYNNRCWSLYKMGEYEKALPDCDESINLYPDDVNALDSRARVYEAMGRADEAIKDFERIIELGYDSDLSQQAEEELRKLRGK